MTADNTDDKLSVLVVDDTAVYRSVLKKVVEAIPTASFAGAAANGKIALDKMRLSPVDFVLLDVEMPQMNGLETLEVIRREFPLVGVVMVSGIEQSAADVTIQALEMGALDFIAKPDGKDVETNHETLVEQLEPLVKSYVTRKNLAQVKQTRVTPSPTPRPPMQEPLADTRPPITLTSPGALPSKFNILVIGVSTGGPKALARVIPLLPSNLDIPVLVVQHMPAVFTSSLARSLSKQSNIPVIEAFEGKRIEPNEVLIAPGGRHMVVRRTKQPAEDLIVGLNENPPENSCRPAVDVLFRSVANAYRGNILALIMTGMGQDGMKGVKSLKKQGCYCLVQDQATSVVYGMPKAVIKAQLADECIPLDRLAKRIITLIKGDH